MNSPCKHTKAIFYAVLLPMQQRRPHKNFLKKTSSDLIRKHDPLFGRANIIHRFLPSTRGENYVVLFQIQQCTLTPSLIEILSRADILKTGVALGRDVDELKQFTPFQAAGFIELADLAKEAVSKTWVYALSPPFSLSFESPKKNKFRIGLNSNSVIHKNNMPQPMHGLGASYIWPLKKKG